MKNGWNNYQSFTLNRDNFNVNVSGSNYLDVGRHSVFIESVERVEGNYGPQLIVTYSDAAGRTMKEYVGLFDTNKDNVPVDYGYRLRMLLAAITSDHDLLFDFLEATKQDPTKFDGLKGIEVDIVIEPGKKGYTIQKEDEKIFVKDVTSGDKMLNADGYEDFTTAAAAVTVFNEQNPNAKLKRAYNRITSFHLNAQEDKNVSTLQAVISSDASTPQGGKLKLQKLG